MIKPADSSVAVYLQQARDHAAQQRPPARDTEDASAPRSEAGDSVSLSGEARRLSKDQEGGSSVRKGVDGETLNDREVRELRSLERRDREVRAHERAHVASGGGLVRGGARFDFEKGPDGKRYAVNGRVSIDTSSAGSPEETIRKMARVQRAALAPSQPSATDRAEAARAARKEMEARAELREEQLESARNRKGQPSQAASGHEDRQSSSQDIATSPSSVGIGILA